MTCLSGRGINNCYSLKLLVINVHIGVYIDLRAYLLLTFCYEWRLSDRRWLCSIYIILGYRRVEYKVGKVNIGYRRRMFLRSGATRGYFGHSLFMTVRGRGLTITLLFHKLSGGVYKDVGCHNHGAFVSRDT